MTVSLENLQVAGWREQMLLLHAANVCLRQGNIDPCHLNAVVVSIYERDDATTREDYRPIIGGVL